MRASLARHFHDPEGGGLRRRGVALGLTVLAHMLLLWLLLRLAPEQFVEMRSAAGALLTFSVQPSPEPARMRARQEQRRVQRQPQPSRSAAAPPVPPPPVTLPAKAAQPLDILQLSREDLATLDTAMGRHVYGPPAPGAATGGGSPGDTPSSTGPNGERLYAAEWYREPSRAEIGPYLPRTATPGTWGEIACRTVARFHVEDCKEIGDSLPGIGIARGMRQAAFQFLVRPPRVGGESLVGTWVRIRITITEGGDIDATRR